MTFDQKLRHFRQSVGLTQAEMAKTLGIGRTTYTNIERGATHPTELFVNCLCAIYGLDKGELLDDSVDALPPHHVHITTVIEEKYNELEDRYKHFVLRQIEELLELQSNK